jgi:hypothetical protein
MSAEAMEQALDAIFDVVQKIDKGNLSDDDRNRVNLIESIARHKHDDRDQFGK